MKAYKIYCSAHDAKSRHTLFTCMSHSRIHAQNGLVVLDTCSKITDSITRSVMEHIISYFYKNILKVH